MSKALVKVFLLTVIFLYAPTAHACSCARVPLGWIFATYFTPVIFSGTVTEIQGNDVFIDVDISRVGITEATGIVDISIPEASCGYTDFQKGNRYLVYASNYSGIFRDKLDTTGRLHVSLCGFTGEAGLTESVFKMFWDIVLLVVVALSGFVIYRRWNRKIR